VRALGAGSAPVGAVGLLVRAFANAANVFVRARVGVTWLALPPVKADRLVVVGLILELASTLALGLFDDAGTGAASVIPDAPILQGEDLPLCAFAGCLTSSLFELRFSGFLPQLLGLSLSRFVGGWR